MDIIINRKNNHWLFYKKNILEYYSRITSNYFTTFFRKKITLFDKNDSVICEFVSRGIFSSTTLIFNPIYNICKCSIKRHNLFYKPYIDLEIKNEYYKIIIHKYPCYTILKNNEQIGYIIEERFYIGNNEKMIMSYNVVENEIILICMIASKICNYRQNNEILNYKHSNAFKEIQSFNSEWKTSD